MGLGLPNLANAQCNSLLVDLSLSLSSKLPQRLDALLSSEYLSPDLAKVGYREFYTQYTRQGKRHFLAGLIAMVRVRDAFRTSAMVVCRAGSWRPHRRVPLGRAQELVEFLLVNTPGRKRAARVQTSFSFPLDRFFSPLLPVDAAGGDELALYSVGFRARYSKTRYNTLNISLSDDAKRFLVDATFFLRVRPPGELLPAALSEARRFLLPVIEER